MHLKRTAISFFLTALFLLPQAYKAVHELHLSLNEQPECPYLGDHFHATEDFHDCSLCDYHLPTFDQRYELYDGHSIVAVPAQPTKYNANPYHQLHFSFQLRGPPLV